jgi:hypothetical protein
VPPQPRDNPQIREALDDPLFVQNTQAFERVQQAFSGFGDQGGALFAQTIQGVRESLAVGIADAFLVAVFVLIAALVIAVFMKEIPLRKAHYSPEEQESAGSLPEAAVALPPVAGGSNGDALSPQPADQASRGPPADS